MIVARDWKDYKILDMANGQKLESWGGIILLSVLAHKIFV